MPRPVGSGNLRLLSVVKDEDHRRRARCEHVHSESDPHSTRPDLPARRRPSSSSPSRPTTWSARGAGDRRGRGRSTLTTPSATRHPRPTRCASRFLRVVGLVAVRNSSGRARCSASPPRGSGRSPSERYRVVPKPDAWSRSAVRQCNWRSKASPTSAPGRNAARARQKHNQVVTVPTTWSLDALRRPAP